MTAAPDRTAGMIQARRSNSAAKRERIQTVLERMQRDSTPITYAHVARQAQVSTWLVYAPDVREIIEAARADQQTRGSQPARRQPRRSADDLETDLALARAEIAKSRAERDEQHQQIRLALGARLDNLAKADLVGIPSGLVPPCGFGISTRLAGTGRYEPARRSLRNSRSMRSTP